MYYVKACGMKFIDKRSTLSSRTVPPKLHWKVFCPARVARYGNGSPNVVLPTSMGTIKWGNVSLHSFWHVENDRPGIARQ